MCGRFALRVPFRVIAEALNAFVDSMFAGVADKPRFNVALTQTIPIVVPVKGEGGGRVGGRELVGMKWGLIPGWAQDSSIGSRMINARAETVTEKPAYRAAFKTRRCLVPADGFYEWTHEGKVKTPNLFELRGSPLFAFAGLWDEWHGPEGAVRSCTLITTQANPLVAPVHNRMPVMLDAHGWEAWLNPKASQGELLDLLKPYPAEEMQVRSVSRWLNVPANDSADLLDSI